MPSSLFLNNNHAMLSTLKNYEQEFIQLRQYLHQYPELSKKEFHTADKIAALLESWGIQVERNIAKTGLVGLLKKGTANRMLGLRADMDALPIQECSQRPYQSATANVMHACGHDGHMAMLLMAAKYLSLHAQFDGQIAFIFQPDEEDTAGARQMIQEGLFDKYPVDAVFAMHCFPGVPAGTLMIRRGPQMAGTVGITIVIEGKGCHAAHPYKGIDSILVASHVMIALQSIISRNLSAFESGVITIGSIHGGEANNVIPQTVTLKGTLRYFSESTRQLMEERLCTIVNQVTAAFDAHAEIMLAPGYIPTINHDNEADLCLTTAQKIFTTDYIKTDKLPSMGAEDFAFMLAEKKGAYLFIGNGTDLERNTLHHHHFDFNDRNILPGACFWSQLAIDFFNDKPETLLL